MCQMCVHTYRGVLVLGYVLYIHTSYIHTYIHAYIHTSYIHTYIIHTYIHHTYIHTSYIHTYKAVHTSVVMPGCCPCVCTPATVTLSIPSSLPTPPDFNICTQHSPWLIAESVQVYGCTLYHTNPLGASP